MTTLLPTHPTPHPTHTSMHTNTHTPMQANTAHCARTYMISAASAFCDTSCAKVLSMDTYHHHTCNCLSMGTYHHTHIRTNRLFHGYSPPEMVCCMKNICLESGNRSSAKRKRSNYSGATVLIFVFNISLSKYGGLAVLEMMCQKRAFSYPRRYLMSPSPSRQCKWTGKLLKVCCAGISYDITQLQLRYYGGCQCGKFSHSSHSSHMPMPNRSISK